MLLASANKMTPFLESEREKPCPRELENRILTGQLADKAVRAPGGL
jgi:hypothetical protein